MPFLGIHRKEGVDEKLLEFMIEAMGARIERVHEVINFECRPFLADWMREIYSERLQMKRQGRAVEAEMLKLVMNAIYGKLIQNVETFKNSQLYTEARKFANAMNGRRMKDFDVIFGDTEFLGIVHSIGNIVLQKSLVQAGWRVLCLSRLQMLRNHYEAIKPIFPGAKVTFTDTDSAHYWIRADAIINFKKKALSPLNDKVFQISVLENRPLGHWRNNEMLAKVGKTFGVKSLVFNKIMIYLIGRADVDRE